MSTDEEPELLSIDEHEVRITHPSKPYFAQAAISKIEVVRYYLAVAAGALGGIRNRPIVLKRFIHGAQGPAFYQKRAPPKLPPFLHTVTLRFPSGRTAEELIIDNAAGLAWIVNLGCLELHPHPVRSEDLDHPDELRVDLDPGPGVSWDDVRKVALAVREVLTEHGLEGWPKTSGSRGIHILVRIQPKWGFDDVRRAALALSRAVERRVPTLATSKWWKEERHGVFLDYNQNAKDRTTCSAYSVRPLPDARVSAPLRWEEVPTADATAFTVRTMPARFAELGDVHALIDANPGSLAALLELADRDEAEGLGDAPWPPHFAKRSSEGRRVAPSRAKKGRGEAGSATGSGSGGEGEVNGAPASAVKKARRKRATMPLIVIANAWDKNDALAGLERWKVRHPEVAALVAIDDVLVDSMRGRSSTWTRIRINLRHVPEEMRPPEEKPDPDDDLSWGKRSSPRSPAGK